MSTLHFINFYRRFTHEAGYIVPPQSHPCYELVYYLTGEGSTMLGNTEHQIAPNTFTVIHPETVHSEHHQTQGEILFIGFEGVVPDNITDCSFADSESRIILATLEGIFSELKNYQIDYKKIIQLKLQELIVYIERLTQTNKKIKNDTVEYAVRYIEQYYSLPIDWKKLASSCNYSYDYFRHMFKETTGVSPIEYLITCKLNAAKELLLHTKLSCTEIAERCGFSNNVQFSQLFKEAYGASPTEYRKASKAKSNTEVEL